MTFVDARLARASDRALARVAGGTAPVKERSFYRGSLVNWRR
jgi:hypothetical protein